MIRTGVAMKAEIDEIRRSLEDINRCLLLLEANVTGEQIEVIDKFRDKLDKHIVGVFDELEETFEKET